MKLLLTFATTCSIALLSSAFAGTITFDGAPTGVDLGGYYQGVTFGAGNQATQSMPPYLPARSGSEALSGSGTANTLSFTFDTPQTSLSFYYVSFLGFTATAYAANGNVVGTFSGNDNYNISAVAGDPSTYSQYIFASLNTGIANISSVVLTAKSGSSAFTFLDDLSAPGISGSPVPDASSTFELFAFVGAMVFVYRRHQQRCF